MCRTRCATALLNNDYSNTNTRTLTQTTALKQCQAKIKKFGTYNNRRTTTQFCAVTSRHSPVSHLINGLCWCHSATEANSVPIIKLYFFGLRYL